MDWIVIILIVCLLIAFAAVLLCLLHLKKEIRHFSEEIERHKNNDYAQPVKISRFDRDTVMLASKLNEYIDRQQMNYSEFRREKEQLNQIISGLSHDFRTPLTASIGYLQLIEKGGELSEESEEYLAAAIRKNKYLKELSDVFFELSILSCANEEIKTDDINLSNLFTDMLVEQAYWLNEKGISPKFEIADGVFVRSNLQYLTRILQNLMSNAEKYSVLHFGASLSEKQGKIFLVVFNDTEDNCTINPDKVFEPFYTGYDHDGKGTGLGLYVVKSLTEKLGYSATAKLCENGIFRIEIAM